MVLIVICANTLAVWMIYSGRSEAAALTSHRLKNYYYTDWSGVAEITRKIIEEASR